MRWVDHLPLYKLVVAAAMASATLWSTATLAMVGDAQAIAMARRLIQNMGGREPWARARWIYAREDAHFSNRPSPADAQYWRRTDRPGWRGLSHGPGWRREFFWEEASGYRVIDGQRQDLTSEDIQQLSGWWSVCNVRWYASGELRCCGGRHSGIARIATGMSGGDLAIVMLCIAGTAAPLRLSLE